MSIPKKPRKCRVCKDDFKPVRCLQQACSFECEVKLGELAAAKSKAKREKAERIAGIEDRKIIKAKLQAIKPRSAILREAQAAFNRFCRERDRLAGYLCISSGAVLDWSGNNVDAGHYRSVGSAPHLRFNELNCHAQSKHDNRYLSGNAVDYRLGLIARIGLAAVEELEADQELRKYSVSELKEIKAHYAAKIKQLRCLQAK